jgi:hypothetical protein
MCTCFTKVVVFFTANPTKLGLHFYLFSTIFYEYYNIQPKAKNFTRISLHRGPWKFLQIHNNVLTLHLRPWTDQNLCNWVYGHGRWRLWPNPSEPATRWPGNRSGRRASSPRVDSQLELGLRRCRRGCAVEPGGVSCGGLKTGKCRGGARRLMVVEASRGSRGGVASVNIRWEGTEGGARRWRLSWHRRSSGDGEWGSIIQHVRARARVRRGEGDRGSGVKVSDSEADLSSLAPMVGAAEHKKLEGRARVRETSHDVI